MLNLNYDFFVYCFLWDVYRYWLVIFKYACFCIGLSMAFDMGEMFRESLKFLFTKVGLYLVLIWSVSDVVSIFLLFTLFMFGGSWLDPEGDVSYEGIYFSSEASGLVWLLVIVLFFLYVDVQLWMLGFSLRHREKEVLDMSLLWDSKQVLHLYLGFLFLFFVSILPTIIIPLTGYAIFGGWGAFFGFLVMVFAIVPLFYVSLFWFLSFILYVYPVVFEQRNALFALKKAYSLSKGNRLSLFFVFFVFFIVYMVILFTTMMFSLLLLIPVLGFILFVFFWAILKNFLVIFTFEWLGRIYKELSEG